jgi:hypothetical protein
MREWKIKKENQMNLSPGIGACCRSDEPTRDTVRSCKNYVNLKSLSIKTAWL